MQIAHGMGEHAARYARLAEALVDARATSCTPTTTAATAARPAPPTATATSARPAGRGSSTTWRRSPRRARAEHPDIPLVLLGHSMGSFALQQYLLDRSGEHRRRRALGHLGRSTSSPPGIDTSQPADLAAFNAPFEPARTDYDWLSRDEAEVDKYVADPACGFGLDMPGMEQMLHGTADDGRPRAAWPRSGRTCRSTSSPATPTRSAGGGALVELVGQRYRDAGVKDVTVKLYPGARHETLNETNRDEVTADLIAWLDDVHGERSRPMITAVHTLIYAEDADAARAFFRDIARVAARRRRRRLADLPHRRRRARRAPRRHRTTRCR